MNKNNPLFFICLVIILFIFIFIPSIVVMLVKYDLINVTTQNDWIGFWGAYLGAALGGAIMILVMMITLKTEKDIALKREKEDYFNNINEKISDLSVTLTGYISKINIYLPITDKEKNILDESKQKELLYLSAECDKLFQTCEIMLLAKNGRQEYTGIDSIFNKINELLGLKNSIIIKNESYTSVEKYNISEVSSNISNNLSDMRDIIIEFIRLNSTR